MEVKYSILMPYFRRAALLHNTLVSFDYHYHDRKDYEVVLVEDPRDRAEAAQHLLLLDVITAFNSTMSISCISHDTPNVTNPSLAYNLAAESARGQYFILTSPEVFHKENILGGLDVIFGENPAVYVVCSCQLWTSATPFASDFASLGGYGHSWYQHSQHRNVKLHFCSALSRRVWEQLGGFDAQFAFGYCWEDQDFIDRVEAAGIPVVCRDDLVTCHQAHPEVATWGSPLWRQNYNLYLRKKEVLHARCEG